MQIAHRPGMLPADIGEHRVPCVFFISLLHAFPCADMAVVFVVIHDSIIICVTPDGIVSHMFLLLIDSKFLGAARMSLFTQSVPGM